MHNRNIPAGLGFAQRIALTVRIATMGALLISCTEIPPASVKGPNARASTDGEGGNAAATESRAPLTAYSGPCAHTAPNVTSVMRGPSGMVIAGKPPGSYVNHVTGTVELASGEIPHIIVIAAGFPAGLQGHPISFAAADNDSLTSCALCLVMARECPSGQTCGPSASAYFPVSGHGMVTRLATHLGDIFSGEVEEAVFAPVEMDASLHVSPVDSSVSDCVYLEDFRFDVKTLTNVVCPLEHCEDATQSCPPADCAIAATAGARSP